MGYWLRTSGSIARNQPQEQCNGMGPDLHIVEQSDRTRSSSMSFSYHRDVDFISHRDCGLARSRLALRAQGSGTAQAKYAGELVREFTLNDRACCRLDAIGHSHEFATNS